MKAFFGRSLIVLLGLGALVAFLAMNGQMGSVKHAIAVVAGVAAEDESTVGADIGEIAEKRTDVSTLVANASATAALTTLALFDRYDTPVAGYSAAAFGEDWVDVDRNGCATVDDILHRDLDPDEREGSCEVQTGVLHDPYTGATVDFVRGTGLVSVDHLISAENAWNGGAADWNAVERAEFFNDPLNLISVSSAAATERSGADAASWMPSDQAFHCDYVQRQVKVLKRYDLAVSDAEHAAAAATLTVCSSH